MNENIFAGLQKLTLLDFPGKVACTLFTKGCNFRCPFCHNASLVVRTEEQRMYDNAEILAFLKKRVGILDGVAITGGEPTLMSGLYDFIKSVKEMGYAVKLDTNGTRPEVLKKLVLDGLVDYVAMDIKNSPEKYAYTCGLPSNYDLSKIEESIRFLMDGHVDFKELDSFMAATREVSDRFGVEFWSNLETFDRDMPWKFPPIEWQKMRLKLEVARKYAKKIITFEAPHFLSSYSCYPAAARLRECYLEYLEAAGEFQTAK